MASIDPNGRYCMLLRKSREDVEAERYGQFETLAQHESALTRLAGALGIKVSKIYRELVSGDRLDERPETTQMIHEVMRGEWDGVLANDVQRISRGDMMDQGFIMNAFEYTGTLIITPSHIYDLSNQYDARSLEQDLMYGRTELHRIKKRLVEGKEERSRRGEYLGSIAPFGWEKCVVDRKKTLRPDGNHDLLYRMYAGVATWTWAPSQIADDFNKSGFPTVRGGHWDAKTVREVIKNPANIGYIRWNQRKVAIVFGDDLARTKVRKPCKDPILAVGLHRGSGRITDELFERANRQLELHSGTSEHSNKPLRNPLAGLLVCKHCGRVMNRSIFPGSHGPHGREKVEWYTHPKSNRHECSVTGARLDDVVGLVVSALAQTAEDIELSLEKGEDWSDKAAEMAVESARKALDDEKRAEANLFRLAERGMISDEEFAERKELLRGRVDALNEQLAQAERRRTTKERQGQQTFALREAIAELRNYRGREKQVNDVLQSIIDRIEYEKDPQTGEIRLGVYLAE